MSGNGKDNGMITIAELIHRIDAAHDGMGDRNPHKHLLAQCRVAIAYLANKMPDESVVTRGGIILP